MKIYDYLNIFAFYMTPFIDSTMLLDMTKTMWEVKFTFVSLILEVKSCGNHVGAPLREDLLKSNFFSISFKLYIQIMFCVFMIMSQ